MADDRDRALREAIRMAEERAKLAKEYLARLRRLRAKLWQMPCFMQDGQRVVLATHLEKILEDDDG
jgi:hypothetical protein